MTVTGLVAHPMELTKPTLKVVDPQQEQQVKLSPLHPTSQALVSLIAPPPPLGRYSRGLVTCGFERTGKHFHEEIEVLYFKAGFR